VTWEMNERKTREREIRAILSATEELGVEKPLILTGAGVKEKIEIDGKDIEVIPIWRWLLQPKDIV
ncbi:MAG: ATP-binding protein, partial [Candidatus Thermoplasmatota archaeon]|nr:ATP-binding protein [Candidatus Thermoplasmatota archaeon]